MQTRHIFYSGNVPEAINAYTTALRLKSDFPDAYCELLGISAIESGKFIYNIISAYRIYVCF